MVVRSACEGRPFPCDFGVDGAVMLTVAAGIPRAVLGFVWRTESGESFGGGGGGGGGSVLISFLGIMKEGIVKSSWGGNGGRVGAEGFRIDVGVRGFWGMDLDAARRFAEAATVATFVGTFNAGKGEEGGAGTVVVAVSRLIWLDGGDGRRMLMAVGVGVVCLAVGRTVLFVLMTCCCGVVATFGILFKSEGFCLARVFRRAAMLAGLEM